MNTLIGAKLLQYELRAIIHHDEHYITYVAGHDLFDREVVVKVPVVQGDKQACYTLKQEATRLMALQHPRLPVLYDFIENADGSCYLITENFQQYLSLENYLDRHPGLTEQKATLIFLQILEGIDFLHQRGVIHPRLNTSHIFLTPDEHVKIVLESELANTSAYQSPEEYKKGTLHVQSNIFSLGMILQKLLETPFKQEIGSQENNNKDLIAPYVSKKMREIIRKATTHSAKRRFQNCKEFMEAITDVKRLDRFSEIAEAFTNLPHIIFGVLATILVFAFYNIGSDSSSSNTLVYDLYDQTRIQKNIDSLKKARKEKLVQDSIQVAKNKTQDIQRVHLHKVQKGERLDKIAARYNMTLPHLKRLNGIEDDGKFVLKANTGLRVVVRDIHKVVGKEELWQIAQKYNISKYEILKANDIIEADEAFEIYEGRNLIIPISK